MNNVNGATERGNDVIGLIFAGRGLSDNMTRKLCSAGTKQAWGLSQPFSTSKATRLC